MCYFDNVNMRGSECWGYPPEWDDWDAKHYYLKSTVPTILEEITKKYKPNELIYSEDLSDFILNCFDENFGGNDYDVNGHDLEQYIYPYFKKQYADKGDYGDYYYYTYDD